MKLQDLKYYVQENPNLVDVKQSENYPEYFVVKYKKRVFWDNLWTPELERCRGLVIDKDWNIISRPFNKVYNFGIEKNAPDIPLDTIVKADRKVNGFMVGITWDKRNDDLLFSTTGSLDSPFVGMAKQSLFRSYRDSLMGVLELFKSLPDETHLFECVHEEDPHIIEEPMKGLYYLGTMQKDLEDDLIYTNHNLRCWFNAPESFTAKIQDIIELTSRVKHEGFMVAGIVNDVFVQTKIKSPYYLVNKFFARKKAVDDVVTHNAKEFFAEEYYPLIKHIEENQKYFTSLSEQDRLTYISKFYGG